MKKFSKYIFTLAALALASTACVKEAEYEKGPQDVEGCYGVYFPAQEAAGDQTYDPSRPTEVEFTVARTNPDGDITVPVKYTESHSGIFQLGELSFVDGEVETTFKVTFPDSEIGPRYKLSLAIDDPLYASRYSDKATHLDFSVMRVEWKYVLNPQTNEPAKFTFNMGFYGLLTEGAWATIYGKVKYYELDGIRYCETETDPVTLGGETYYGFYGEGSAQGEGEFSFNWYPEKKLDDEGTKELVELPLRPAFKSDGTDIYAFDAYWFAYLTGATEDKYVDYAMKNKDTANYYSCGEFAFYLPYYLDLTGYGWSNPSPWGMVLTAEGFNRTDYSLSLAAGQSTDGQLPVKFTTGADVAKVKYAVFEGELYAAQVTKNVAAIADGTQESVEVTAEQLDANNLINITLEETGVYTLVAVTCDAEGAAQKSASVSFGYVAAEDEVPVVVSAGIGSADKYVPAGVNTDYALEYWIYGKDLKSVQMGVFSAQDLAKGTQECLAQVLASEPVSAEILEEINGEGYVSVVDKLNPGTQYHLLVVASNGFETKPVISEGVYTTGDPHPVYMNFTAADLKDELIPESSEGYFGTYNYYAKNTDDEGNLISTRAYLGQVTISDSSEPDLPADSYGIVTEYVDIRGLFPVVTLLGGETDAITFEYYDGVLYNLVAPLSPVTLQGTTFYPLPVPQDADGGFYKKGDYGLVGGYVKEGYLAFVNGFASQGIDMRGFQILIYPDQTYTSPVSYLDLYHDVLLINPEKDDSGLAPEEDAPSASQLKQISNTLKLGPTNYVETPRGNIRSIIDKARQTPVLRGQFTGIQGERDAKAVSFRSEFSSDKVQKFSKNDSYTKVANISLR